MTRGASPTAPCRRTFLAAGAAACGGLLAACGSGAEPGPAAAPSDAPSDAGPAEPAAAPGPLVALADVEVGATVSATTPDGRPVLVSRTSETEVVAHSAVCTHEGCTVMPSGDCPCHGSKFDPTSGEVLDGPAGDPLEAVRVQVVDGQVVTV